MKRCRCCCLAGYAMMEVVVAAAIIGVLLPAALVLLAGAGESRANSRLELVGLWVVPACLNEGAADLVANSSRTYAVSREGELLGRIDDEQYRIGVRACQGRAAGYLCRVSVGGQQPTTGMRRIDVTMEGPAAAQLAGRRKLEFHTMVK